MPGEWGWIENYNHLHPEETQHIVFFHVFFFFNVEICQLTLTNDSINGWKERLLNKNVIQLVNILNFFFLSLSAYPGTAAAAAATTSQASTVDNADATSQMSAGMKRMHNVFGSFT